MIKKILITGGAGFIGSHLAKSLIGKTPHDVVLLDTSNSASPHLALMGLAENPRITFISGSVTEPSDYGRLPPDINFVVHAAAILGIDRVSKDQIATLNSSVLGTLYCLQFARTLPALERFTYFSTSEIYGISAAGSMESDPAVIKTDAARWCYAASKLCGEFYVKAFAEEYGFPYTVIRPFNVYGPYRQGLNAMTTLIARAVSNLPLRLSGDGKQTRSWCHIDDFTSGLLTLSTMVGGGNHSFNLGNDQTEISMSELAELIRRLAGSSSEILFDEINMTDVMSRRPDISRARATIGFRPGIDLETGVGTMLTWLQNLGNLSSLPREMFR